MEIEKIKAEVDHLRKELPPDWQPPTYTQTTPAMQATFKEVDAAVRPLLTRYAKLVYDADKVLAINTAKLAEYRGALEPIKLCDDDRLRRRARFLDNALAAVINRKERTARELAERVYLSLKIAEVC